MVKSFEALIPKTSQVHFLELAQAFADYANDKYQARRLPNAAGPLHPLGGVLTQSELYPAFVETPGQPDPIPTTELDGVIALILIFLVIQHPESGVAGAISKLAIAIGNPMKKRNLDAANLVTKALQGSRKNLGTILPLALTSLAGADDGYESIVKMDTWLVRAVLLGKGSP